MKQDITSIHVYENGTKALVARGGLAASESKRYNLTRASHKRLCATIRHYSARTSWVWPWVDGWTATFDPIEFVSVGPSPEEQPHAQ